MQPLPHNYRVTASAGPEGSVSLAAAGLPAIASAPPVEYDGPGDQWSPETLLTAATVDCFVLTFRAIARASKLEWRELACRAEGTLDRVEHVTRFVGMRIEASLTLPRGSDPDAGRRLLEKAEKTCLVTNSLDLEVVLETTVTVDG